MNYINEKKNDRNDRVFSVKMSCMQLRLFSTNIGYRMLRRLHSKDLLQ